MNAASFIYNLQLHLDQHDYAKAVHQRGHVPVQPHQPGSPDGDLWGRLLPAVSGKMARVLSGGGVAVGGPHGLHHGEDRRYARCHELPLTGTSQPSSPSSGTGDQWHGHVTAVTCSPTHRRLGLASRLMDGLEAISEKKKCLFVDLFVRVSNYVAIRMYEVTSYWTP